MCESVQDIGNTLEVTHISTSQVKESKINFLVTKYKKIFMREDEHIVSMITRFTDITNGLKSLCRIYSNTEKGIKKF